MKKVIENAIVASVNAGANFPTAEATIASLEVQIKNALIDYFTYAPECGDRESAMDYVDENFTDNFIRVLAHDSYHAKSKLRDMFRKSPAWNENLQCLIVNGNRTHEPDKRVIWEKAKEILQPAINKGNVDNANKIFHAIRYFSYDTEEDGNILIELAPKANLRQKKSKVFGALCKALGIWQDSGEFQMKFSDLCNEFNAKKVDEKIYYSLNPAHFMTMSNPYGKYFPGKSCNYDDTFLVKDGEPFKKAFMKSCHSLNSEHSYKNGCTGYARDDVTVIAFTVHDSKDEKSLNYRKTNRQLFGYVPGNGVLLQSRLYTSFRHEEYGGISASEAEGNETIKQFRNLLQLEIAECENFPNFWEKPVKYAQSLIRVQENSNFSGYPDWIHLSNQAIISVTKYEGHAHAGFTMGASAICTKCGENFYPEDDNQTTHCEDCREDNEEYGYCEICGERIHMDDLMTAYDERGNEIWVCEDCREEYYFYCEDCGRYHHNDHSHWVGDDCDGHYVCDNCFEEYYYCEHCECYEKNTYRVYDVHGNEIYVCDYCFEEYYSPCKECGRYFHNDALEMGICPECAKKAEQAEKNSDDNKNAA